MAKEDISLPVEMGKLEIEPVKNKGNTDSNPFFHSQQRRNLSRSSTQTFRCHCPIPKNKSSIAICKKKCNNKILKKPVLKLLQNYCKDHEEPQNCQLITSKLVTSLSESDTSENSILCALVDNCNQLRISAESEKAAATSSNGSRWWQKEMSCGMQMRESNSDKSRTSGPSCSQQALNPPCDVTIDELASYFETFVHIPKKMSSMAEMMYI